MGAFTDDGGPPSSQEEPEQELDIEKPEIEEPTGFSTDVEGVVSDDEHAHGNIKFPVFNVGKNEFYQNMNYGRKRLRFKSGSNAQKYMSGTKYKRSFYVSYTDSKGKTYQRKIK